jgi:glycosyltransferase involved in cell wall biosynthesis
MCVLVTTPAMDRPGGVTQYMRTLRPYLPEWVHFFTVGSRAGKEPALSVLLRTVRDWRRFTRTLKEGDYGAVHLNPSIGIKALLRDGALLLIAKQLKKPVVVFAHGWDQHCARILTEHFSWAFKSVYGRADAFIVLGNAFEHQLKLLGYSGPVFVHGAPVENSLLDSGGPAQGNAAGGMPKCTILFLARIEKEKGIYEALDAYRLVKSECPFVNLVIAGDGSELPRARAHSRKLGLTDISFTGYVDGPAKRAIYRTSDVYLFPSYSEGLPISVLEAMAAGLPIVTSAVGGLRDFFQDGRMGFMTDSRKPAVLASLLKRIAGDGELRFRIGRFNRHYARNHFSSSRIASCLEGVYRRLLDSTHQEILHAR